MAIWKVVAVSRSNRLLLAGGVISLLGAVLVLVVMMGQGGSSDAPTIAADDPAGAATADADGVVDDGASTDEPAVPAVQTDASGQPVFDVPEGMEAVALTVDFQRSVAGLPAVGDRVNVYGVFTNQAADPVADLGGDGAQLPAVRRVLADVPILAVTGASHSSNGGAPTFVVALAPEDVEAALYVHTAESIYLTLVDDETETSPATEGVNAGTLGR